LTSRQRNTSALSWRLFVVCSDRQQGVLYRVPRRLSVTDCHLHVSTFSLHHVYLWPMAAARVWNYLK